MASKKIETPSPANDLIPGPDAQPVIVGVKTHIGVQLGGQVQTGWSLKRNPGIRLRWHQHGIVIGLGAQRVMIPWPNIESVTLADEPCPA